MKCVWLQAPRLRICLGSGVLLQIDALLTDPLFALFLTVFLCLFVCWKDGGRIVTITIEKRSPGKEEEKRIKDPNEEKERETVFRRGLLRVHSFFFDAFLLSSFLLVVCTESDHDASIIHSFRQAGRLGHLFPLNEAPPSLPLLSMHYSLPLSLSRSLARSC